jgi:hippurate hydrolase
LQEKVGIPSDLFFDHVEPGFYVDVWGTGPEADVGRKLILRTELDALRMTEENPDLPYCSVNEGACHACGHDGHMASLMASGWFIWQHRAEIPSNCLIRMLFQPAEEGFGGAVPTIEHGVLEGIDEIYAYHNTPEEELGKIYCPDREIMAHRAGFTITVTGKGGHGAYPHLAVDPILAAT